MTRESRRASAWPACCPAALAILWLTLMAGPAAAQPSGAPLLALDPGFTPDPQTVVGTAGGPVNAQSLGSTPLGACVGWIPQAPQLEITLSAPFDYLRLAVQSGGDTTMVVEGPVGNWCNDDSADLNPAVFGRWAAGHYRVFVGTYQTGQSIPYTLTVTSVRPGDDEMAASPSEGEPPTPRPAAVPPGAPPAGPPATPPATTPPPVTVPPVGRPPAVPPVVVPPVVAPPVRPAMPVGPAAPAGLGLDTGSTTPNFSALSLYPGFAPDPQTLSGTSGGTVDAGSIGSSPTGPCRGWVAPNPDHVLTLTGPLPYLHVDVQSGGDTTLVIQGPSGFWCNDDAVGLNPRIGGAWAPGTYRIWVGSYNGAQYLPYTITFSQAYPR